MKKCDIVLSTFIERVHGVESKNKGFVPKKKFPVIILKDLIGVFFYQFGACHNDVKPSNLGYLLDEEGYPRGQFIDFGSIGY